MFVDEAEQLEFIKEMKEPTKAAAQSEEPDELLIDAGVPLDPDFDDKEVA